MITTPSKISYGSQVAPPVIQAVQGDTGRTISFEVSDYDIPEGAMAVYFILKPSGEAVYNAATISGQTITCVLTAQALAETGQNKMQVRVMLDDDVVTSFNVTLMVSPFYGDNAVESGTEATIFDQIVAQAEDDFHDAASDIVEEVIASIPQEYTALEQMAQDTKDHVDSLGLSVVNGKLCVTYSE